MNWANLRGTNVGNLFLGGNFGNGPEEGLGKVGNLGRLSICNLGWSNPPKSCWIETCPFIFRLTGANSNFVDNLTWYKKYVF